MNPLQRLIQDEMNALGLKRSELIQQMGYRNISKGLRKMDTLLDTLGDRERLLPFLQDALCIPDEKFQTAVSELQEQLTAVKRVAFKPFIRVVPTGEPRRYSFFSRPPWWLVDIDVPENLSLLPADHELLMVCGLCRTHRLRYEAEFEGVTSNKGSDQGFERAAENLLPLPSDQGLPSACEVCGKQRKRFKEEILGFIYHRNYDECFEFDQDCFLVKHIEHNQDSLTKAAKKILNEESRK